MRQRAALVQIPCCAHRGVGGAGDFVECWLPARSYTTGSCCHCSAEGRPSATVQISFLKRCRTCRMSPSSR